MTEPVSNLVLSGVWCHTKSFTSFVETSALINMRRFILGKVINESEMTKYAAHQIVVGMDPMKRD